MSRVMDKPEDFTKLGVSRRVTHPVLAEERDGRVDDGSRPLKRTP